MSDFLRPHSGSRKYGVCRDPHCANPSERGAHQSLAPVGAGLPSAAERHRYRMRPRRSPGRQNRLADLHRALIEAGGGAEIDLGDAEVPVDFSGQAIAAAKAVIRDGLAPFDVIPLSPETRAPHLTVSRTTPARRHTPGRPESRPAAPIAPSTRPNSRRGRAVATPPPSRRPARCSMSDRSTGASLHAQPQVPHERSRLGLRLRVRCIAASKATAEGAKSVCRINFSASCAPYSRSMPLSSHSIDSGPS